MEYRANEREGGGSGCFIRSLHNLNLASSSTPTLSLPNLRFRFFFFPSFVNKLERRSKPDRRKKERKPRSLRSWEPAGYGNPCDGVTFASGQTLTIARVEPLHTLNVHGMNETGAGTGRRAIRNPDDPRTRETSAMASRPHMVTHPPPHLPFHANSGCALMPHRIVLTDNTGLWGKRPRRRIDYVSTPMLR